jgi:hypothetical protein
MCDLLLPLVSVFSFLFMCVLPIIFLYHPCNWPYVRCVSTSTIKNFIIIIIISVLCSMKCKFIC